KPIEENGDFPRVMPNTAPHYRNCNLCEAICGIEITVKAEQRLNIRGDEDDPFSRGYICPKAVALQDIHFDTDRLRHPVRRTPNGWEPISWEQAFDEVANNLKRINAQYGRNSIAAYLGNPNVHNYGALLFAPRFLRSLHTSNKFSATSVDQLAHHLAAYLMFGHQLLLPIPDIDRTDLFLILGANPAVSNGSMMTAPGMSNRLHALQQRGGKVILIDPRHNETAKHADRHLFIRPGTDVFLLLALLQVVFDERRTRLDHLSSFTTGIEEIAKAVAEFPPERTAPVTGIDADEIRSIARQFAAATSAVCYGRIGVSTQEFGGVCQWLINVLNIVTGNLDRPGGAMFTLPAFDPITAPESLTSRGSYGRWQSRVRKLPEFAGELPVAALAEEILTEGDGQVKALVTLAGNPVLSTPNGRYLDRALESLEFMVSIDPYINETTRHAHVILPPTSPLERGHYDVAFHLLAVRNIAKFSPALFDRHADARHDWEILLELETRMRRDGLRGKMRRKLISRFFDPERILDLGLRFGPYGAKLNPFSKGLTLRRVKRASHGIDLGPLKPCLPGRLRTVNRQINLAPDVFVKDLERVRVGLASSVESNGDLLLIGRRQLRSNNSWMHNSQRLVKGNPAKPQCTILMHPTDAADRDLTHGQEVVVTSRVGSIVLPVELTDEIMRGVVSIPHGWGHDREGNRLTVAQQHSGASINDLTDELAIDEVCGTAAFNGTKVTVTAAHENHGRLMSNT
ncbi:MAG TPA: molybdopterin-dependent oxidoreductase, partial [Pyrinomonadaceae bacterium]|nr:molybdopterin-dependent oxidoreductase [Pyrinomonadaceae bacterium]